MTSEGQAAAELRTRMAQATQTSAQDWYLVGKARQGMQATLCTVRKTTGRDEVATQLFTCVTAINPILAAGMHPVYVDIDPQTLSLDAGALELGNQTGAVVLQHSYGLIDRASSVALRDAAHAAGAILLEDCAHCVGRIARDESGEPVADVSVHSFGVEKILAGTYFGGAVWINPSLSDAALAQAIRTALDDLPAMDKRLDKATRSYLNQVRILTRLPQGASKAMRARWERRGTFEPAVSEEERRGGTNHDPSKPTEWVCEQALGALASLDDNEAQRRACVNAYLSAFSSAPNELFVPAGVRAAADQPLLRFPVFMPDGERATAAAQAVERQGYYVPAWPRPLLVPGVLDPVPYGIAQGTKDWPVSQELSERSVALPTDVDPSAIPTIAQTVLDLL